MEGFPGLRVGDLGTGDVSAMTVPVLLAQHAKVATLEKQNRDLSWQVAMLARPGGTSGTPSSMRPPSSGSVPTAPQARASPPLTRRCPAVPAIVLEKRGRLPATSISWPPDQRRPIVTECCGVSIGKQIIG